MKHILNDTLYLKNLEIEFDGAEGGCFWIYDKENDNFFKLELYELNNLLEYLNEANKILKQLK